MSGACYPAVERWRLPRKAFVASLEEMRADGELGNEGIALWLGRQTGAIVTVTHVVRARGADVRREPAHLHVGAATMNELTDLTIALDVILVGQIHSHGAYAGTDLSTTDRRYGIAVPFYLSLVAPDYAMRPNTSLLDCGVHVFEHGTGYRRLSPDETTRRIELLDDDAPTLTLGESP